MSCEKTWRLMDDSGLQGPRPPTVGGAVGADSSAIGSATKKKTSGKFKRFAAEAAPTTLHPAVPKDAPEAAQKATPEAVTNAVPKDAPKAAPNDVPNDVPGVGNPGRSAGPC